MMGEDSDFILAQQACCLMIVWWSIAYLSGNIKIMTAENSRTEEI